MNERRGFYQSGGLRMDDLVTKTGLLLDDPGIGDIVTLKSTRVGDASYSKVIFQVKALTATDAALAVRWTGTTAWNIGERILIRRSEWLFTEASELLDALT